MLQSILGSIRCPFEPPVLPFNIQYWYWYCQYLVKAKRPPTLAWEVARTFVAPPSSVVKCLCEVFLFLCGFGVLFLPCGCRCRGCCSLQNTGHTHNTRTTTQPNTRTKHTTEPLSSDRRLRDDGACHLPRCLCVCVCDLLIPFHVQLCVLPGLLLAVCSAKGGGPPLLPTPTRLR